MTVRCVRWLALPLFIAFAAPAEGQIPQKFENLQILPKDIARDSLITVMRGFALSLGVRCQYCHVENPGAAPGSLNLNFASDERTTKQKARFMLRMVDSLNRFVLPRVPDRHEPTVTVGCVTCHRGVSTPMTIETVLLQTVDRAGADSAVARYRALRADMANGSWDFTELPVSEAARTLGLQGNYDAALRLLAMNQEFYPNSVNIDFQIAELLITKGERDAGIARLRAVLTKNPNNQRARARLQQLGVSP